MCPDDHCTINTNKPYTISHASSSAEGGKTVGNINTWFSQNGKSHNFNVCDDHSKVRQIGYSFGNMGFAASLWGSNNGAMKWLDGMTGCSGDCDIHRSSVTYSNFGLFKISGEEELL